MKNEAHSDAFKLYENSKTRRHLLDGLHARELSMSRLYDWLVASLNEHNLTVTAALKHPAFNLLDRQRLKHWQGGLYSQIDLAAELLLPPGEEPAAPSRKVAA